MSESKPDTAPLKRHESLIPFSRDHYVGLVQAQHLIKSQGSDAAARRAAVADFLDVWAVEIEPHFQDEERLLAALMAAGDRVQFEEEHARLRALALEARHKRQQIDPESEWVKTLGQLLNDHIRWEERHLFPAIEKSASEEQLKALGEETRKFEAGRPRSSCRKATGEKEKRS